jgi:hypothetical protein
MAMPQQLEYATPQHGRRNAIRMFRWSMFAIGILWLIGNLFMLDAGMRGNALEALGAILLARFGDFVSAVLAIICVILARRHLRRTTCWLLVVAAILLPLVVGLGTFSAVVSLRHEYLSGPRHSHPTG